MNQLHTEAFVLHSLPYGDCDRIVKLFSKDEGLITTFMKGASRPHSALHSLIHPLHRVDISYRKGKGEIDRLIEGRLMRGNLSLRQSLPALQAGFKLANSLLKSQVPGRAALPIFHLTCAYLEKLGTLQDPMLALASFQLKLLSHEGLFSFSMYCDQCNKSLLQESSFLFGKGNFCHQCSQGRCFEISPKEREQICDLSQVRSFEKLEKISPLPFLKEKVERIFEEVIQEG